MGIKSILSKWYAAYEVRKLRHEAEHALLHQDRILKELMREARDTVFGVDHSFKNIQSYHDFRSNVPVRDYEQLREPYIEQLLKGGENVLYPGKPLYLSKTSGTTSGVKYIPITKASMPAHIKAAKLALLCYIHETGKSEFVDGKMIFLQGSPELQNKAGIPTGRLSGIVAHHVPSYLQANRLPSWESNCIEDWEEKLDAIVEETYHQDMRLISGIPPWVQMYFDRLAEKSGGKSIQEVFPNFSLFVYGGVNFEPYRAKIEQSIGRAIDTIETYPASEGFIAFQDLQANHGLLLNTNAGIFFEFIPVSEFYQENPTRLSLAEVQLDVNYAIILSTNAGLWAYNIGDTVKFTSVSPYRIVVTGRLKHFISAFGEHVIGEEVEHALLSTANQLGISVVEFTVAPQVNPMDTNLPYHEWFIEFEQIPEQIQALAEAVDLALQQKNIYYQDLRAGNILQNLVIRPMKKNAFIDYMRSQGKLGGQNKVPRLANDRKIADALQTYSLST